MTFLTYDDGEKWSRIFYFETHRAPSDIPANLQGQFSTLHWAAATLKGLGEVVKSFGTLFTIIFKQKNVNFKTRDFSPLIKWDLAGVIYFSRKISTLLYVYSTYIYEYLNSDELKSINWQSGWSTWWFWKFECVFRSICDCFIGWNNLCHWSFVIQTQSNQVHQNCSCPFVRYFSPWLTQLHFTPISLTRIFKKFPFLT